jgi:peroxiredoxin
MDLARSGGREPIKRNEEDPYALTREAVQFYDRVVEKYPDFEGTRGRLAERAAQSLFHLRDLAVGKPAPEVDGPDVDGKPLKLSDYRGKVVVLTFSVDLPGPCRDAYPHYRALIERMKGRLFAMLSVNLDENKQTLKNAIASGEITWRCWWEGFDKRPNGDRWHVGFIPSVYVIDADGIIRAKEVKGKALDEAIDALMAAIEQTPAKSGSNP